MVSKYPFFSRHLGSIQRSQVTLDGLRIISRLMGEWLLVPSVLNLHQRLVTNISHLHSSAVYASWYDSRFFKVLPLSQLPPLVSLCWEGNLSTVLSPLLKHLDLKTTTTATFQDCRSLDTGLQLSRPPRTSWQCAGVGGRENPTPPTVSLSTPGRPSGSGEP